uniref:Telomere-associated protein Rif1 N-terminal domain-containing protein n=1 Tax=Periophthalmus magnuspinnatus TaxID=409849 RepID=A0A3B4AZN2_9GOBI
MATAVPPGSSSFMPLLESLEDGAAGTSGQTDAYLTIANRLSGDEGRHFLPAVEKHFSRLGKIILAHITSTNVELSQAALQALGFCVYHSNVASGASEEILSALCSLVVKSTDKNTCTRALWVISKQNFPSKIVPSVLSALESVWSRDDIQSVVMEHEALNVVIRLLEQVPAQMGEGAVRWAKLVLPLVVHSASKVRLRAAAALEMGLSLLLEKQTEVAAIIEPMMSTKLIPELQKLFMTKNETNVLKLWPLFVRLLGKLLHKGGPFINSLLHLEEQGFRSSSPTIKKIAFLAWKSLIDNFALNPDILCSSKRMKLLMQPLSSINVRTEPLLLTKVEVWWYLVVQLGPNLAPNFDVVSVPLLQSTIGCESVSVPGTPSRGGIQNGGHAPGTPKNGGAALNASLATPRMNLNSSVSVSSSFPSIQLLGLEMLLHYFMGPEVVAAAAQNKLKLSLEPLKTPFLSGASSFTKHAAVLITCVRDGLIGIGKDFLIEATVKAIPPRVLASASYQVGKMDVLNGTPALFLIQLLYDSSMLSAYVEDERWVLPSDSDVHTYSNEVNQGDALEHNFSAMYSALMFPMTHLLQASQKSLLSTWSKLYKVFARCSALVITAEENICCEELCAKMAAVPSTLNVVSNILQVLVDSVDFTPYTPHFQQKVKSPHTPVNWMKKRNKVLGNLSTFQSLVVQCLNVFLDECGASSEAPGVALVSVLSTLFSNLVLASAVQELLSTVVQPLTRLYNFKVYTFHSVQLEKFISEALSSLQSRSTLAFNSELLELLCPLLCVLFSHKNKQLRTTVTHFWNASFANSISLVYPEELRPILSQVKQKTPIILPGFEVVSVPDDLSGQDLSECSQLETKLSGIPISSLGKRDSLLGKTPEAKDRTSSKTSKLTKLDFGSPKAPCRSVLEEEASVDFVFIPPETKERVLTEHQKEVKRTKRVDIPAMYNNLDASLDSTAFTQYTQSQDSTSAPEATDGAGKTTEAVPEETQDFVSPRAEEQKSCDQQDEVVPDSTDVSMEEEVQNEETNKDTNSQANVSPNTSQVASGTPQKSRRQPFITLEQYGDGKPSSPSSVFTGSKVKTSNSQKISPSTPSTADSLNSQTEKPTTSVDTTPESPRLPKDGKELKGVKLTDRLPSDTTEDEDMIPDTQTETQAETPTEKKTQTEMPTDTPTETAADTPTETPTETAADTPTKEESSSQESQSSKHSEESDVDSQLSQGEPRRSSRQRVRPLLPGEDPGERDEKFAQLKRRRSAEDVKAEVQVKHYTRSKCAEEDGTKDRRRTRSQAEKEESSQTGSGKRRRRFSGSQDFVEKPGRRRSLRETRQSDSESQSEKESRPVGRPPRKSKVTPEKEKDEVKEKTEMAKDEPNSNGSVTSSLQSSPDSQAVVVLKKIDGELQPSPSATPDSSVLSEVKVELEKELEKCPSDCTQAEDANVLDVNQEDAVGDVSEPQVDSQSCSAQNEPQDAETQMQITEPLESPSDPTADGLSEEEETKTTEEPQDQPLEASEGATAIHDISEDNAEVMEGEEKPEDHVVHPSEELKVTETTDAEGEACATAEDDALPASPVKQMDPETPAGPEAGPEAGQSPSSLTKGTWSPTASPSTSILKKAQKRALEVETPSPLVKSRRVSFADPIQHQELADDIDRRSPDGHRQHPSFVTTPTKGLITLSPRNLNSPGYKSSKKCLISEMGQEPRPVSKDCIYPALVGCTAPVEAVLPRIASTVWSRGFGQIVRARNIKTVGDLSALTPTEVKVLPIRSPKISNVKKALKIYEQQQDSSVPAPPAPQTSADPGLVSELEPNHTHPPPDPLTSGDLVPGVDLVTGLELLQSRSSLEALSRCSPQQLLVVHQRLGDMMKAVVLEMHSRLSNSHSQ